jgi:hypothetical protein
MFGLRFVIDASRQACTYVSDAFLNFKRDLQLIVHFHHYEQQMLTIFEEVWPGQDHRTNHIKVIGIMPTISFKTLLAAGQDVDGCAIFCDYRADVFRRFQHAKHDEDSRKLILASNIRLVFLIDALTDPAKFDEQMTCFLQTDFGTRFHGLVKQMVLDYLREYYSTKMLVFWISRGDAVLLDGMNCRSDIPICFNDAMTKFKKQCDIAVERKIERMKQKREQQALSQHEM